MVCAPRCSVDVVVQLEIAVHPRGEAGRATRWCVNVLLKRDLRVAHVAQDSRWCLADRIARRKGLPALGSPCPPETRSQPNRNSFSRLGRESVRLADGQVHRMSRQGPSEAGQQSLIQHAGAERVDFLRVKNRGAGSTRCLGTRN